MVKFSVIIPAYNCADYISEAIDSVLAQTYTDYEIIVVDDGSTDSTTEILNNYSGQIKIHKQSNAGVSVARNAGAQLADGEYLAFLDSDDIWLENKLQKQSEKISSGFEICYSNKYNFGEIGDLPQIQTDVFHMPEGFIYEHLLLGNVVTTSSVVMNKKTFESLGGFDTNLTHCEDWDLWLKAAEKFHFGVDLEPLLKYRVLGGSLSRRHQAMISARNIVVANALNSEHSRSLPIMTRVKVLSTSFSCSAWEAAKAKDYSCSLKYYCKSLGLFPFDSGVWYDFIRLISGRV